MPSQPIPISSVYPSRAYLVGEQSFGKGVVQHFFPFEDGSGLKVRIAFPQGKQPIQGHRDLAGSTFSLGCIHNQ